MADDATGVDSGIEEVPSAPCDASAPFGALEPIAGIVGQTLRISDSGLDAYFSDFRVGGEGSYDLYTAHRDDPTLRFDEADAISALNTITDDVSPTVTSDGLTAVFESSRSGAFELWAATRATSLDAFSAPTLIGALDSEFAEAEPYLAADGASLYFRSTRSGQSDIWWAAFDGVEFSAPVALAEVNSASKEVSPVLSDDELTIFFASNRPYSGAMGGADIWVASRTSRDEPFGSPVPVTELNSPDEDLPSDLSADGCTIYMDVAGAGTPFMATRAPTEVGGS